MPHAIEYRRLRAPREHGEAIIDPPLSAFEAKLAPHDSAHSRSWLGTASPARPSFTTGHQPELYHPGVWFKNFVLSTLGKRHDLITGNLIVDNDVVTQPMLRVPRPDPPYSELIPIDDAADELPYEERRVLNPALFDSLPERVGLRGTLLEAMWPEARRIRAATGNFGQAISGARLTLERSYGVEIWDVPVSKMCDRVPAFARFSLDVLSELPRFQHDYNASLAEFRRVHRIRSRSHPVPELGRDGDWWEAPLWIWSTDRPRRTPLWVQRSGDKLTLSNRRDVTFGVKLGEHAPDEWSAARQAGYKVRPRALITTMFARLVSGDIFLHGIGGAKYDQLTDAIIAKFFGIVPPQYMTVTATMKLFPEQSVDRALTDARRAIAELREIPFHPEKFLPADASDEALALASAKQMLLPMKPQQGSRKNWHRALAEINNGLLGQSLEALRMANEAVGRTVPLIQKAAVLGSREWSFCLFGQDLPAKLKALAEHR